MAGEAWFRNPTYYIKELAEVGPKAARVIWDRGVLVKNRLDPRAQAEGSFGPTIDYRILLCGPQGTAEVRRESSVKQPSAVYPTFEYGRHKFDDLEGMLALPAGENVGAYTGDPYFFPDPDEQPVEGQEHRVVLIRTPPLNTGEGKMFLKGVVDLQQDYPDAIVHLHGIYSMRAMFGLGLGASDFEARTDAAKRRIILPNGRPIYVDEFAEWSEWIALLGFRPEDLDQPRQRCLFNIKAALWAAENFEQDTFWTARRSNARRTQVRATEDVIPAPPEANKQKLPKGLIFDKNICDVCSLAPRCKIYREGGVCTIPGTNTAKLAAMFKSRDADQIIDALGSLMAVNVDRLEQGLDQEVAEDDLDPQITRIIRDLFNQGVDLAKLVNPLVGMKVGVSITASSSKVISGNEKALAAGLIAELESMGYTKDQMTPELINTVLDGYNKRQAIAVTSTQAP